MSYFTELYYQDKTSIVQKIVYKLHYYFLII